MSLKFGKYVNLLSEKLADTENMRMKHEIQKVMYLYMLYSRIVEYNIVQDLPKKPFF